MEVPIDKEVQPVVQSLHMTQFNLHERIEQNIDELVKLYVIEKANSPKPVVEHEQSDILLCIDMRQATFAIVMERHPIPTVEKVIQDLKRCSQNLNINGRFIRYKKLSLESAVLLKCINEWFTRGYRVALALRTYLMMS